jgi:hypothetical protein
MSWERHAVRIGEKTNACRILTGKPGGRKPCRWMNNIKMDLGEIGLDGMNWTDLVQDKDQ